ncbi:hypothetical protein FHT76_005358 [Rhizobium sp. BK176]|nr:hypothetical protein [Rhizobium sp. BK181]MBB3544588.1 hypothetical protein [Rhizobium sp. BK399]MCS3741613.1 hypothetical protein [Rhizobium sp. BK661]MCS4093664.1 hypothetical protein [Rhizobium sp. BK176]
MIEQCKTTLTEYLQRRTHFVFKLFARSLILHKQRLIFASGSKPVAEPDSVAIVFYGLIPHVRGCGNRFRL